MRGQIPGVKWTAGNALFAAAIVLIFPVVGWLGWMLWTRLPWFLLCAIGSVVLGFASLLVEGWPMAKEMVRASDAIGRAPGWRPIFLGETDEERDDFLAMRAALQEIHRRPCTCVPEIKWAPRCAHCVAGDALGRGYE